MTPTEELHRDLRLSWIEIKPGRAGAEAKHANLQRTYARQSGGIWQPFPEDHAALAEALENRKRQARARDWDSERDRRAKRHAAKSLENLPPHPGRS